MWIDGENTMYSGDVAVAETPATRPNSCASIPNVFVPAISRVH